MLSKTLGALRDKARAIDISALTGKAKDAADAARQVTQDSAARLRSRIKDPADAYDSAVDNFLEVAETLPSLDGEDLAALKAAGEVLKEDNPLR